MTALVKIGVINVLFYFGEERAEEICVELDEVKEGWRLCYVASFLFLHSFWQTLLQVMREMM